MFNILRVAQRIYDEIDRPENRKHLDDISELACFGGIVWETALAVDDSEEERRQLYGEIQRHAVDAGKTVTLEVPASATIKLAAIIYSVLEKNRQIPGAALEKWFDHVWKNGQEQKKIRANQIEGPVMDTEEAIMLMAYHLALFGEHDGLLLNQFE